MIPDLPIRPTLLMVPGLNNSGPTHWQSLWEQSLDRCHRAELGDWDAPARDDWIARLDAAIAALPSPVLLVAHSLGCHAVVWWAATASAARTGKVSGALLIAPPDVDDRPADPAIAGFGPTPKGHLPFPSILVASRDDPYMPFSQSQDLATHWGSRLADAGAVGHINAASGLGAWPYGQALLRQLIDTAPADHR